MINNLYYFFDKIVCINLRHRKDRYNSAKNLFDKLNIPNVEFYIADKSSIDGRYGCFESHINVIKKAYIQDCNNILIFEDDIRPSIFYNINLLKDSIEFMKNNEYDIFYLGYFPFNKVNSIYLSSEKITKNIISYNPFATHAYCLNRISMKKILDNYKIYIGKIHIDKFYTYNYIFKNYCITPMIFEQIYCSPIDNSIHGIDEIFCRKIQCFAGDYLNLGSRCSYFIYLLNNYKIIFIIIMIIILYYSIRFVYLLN